MHRGAVRASHSFLRSYIHLARSPLFSAYLWYCPGTYQPLHATMILLLDLHERPLAAEAPRSRVFVDEVFSLFQSQQGEAWRMLERLRRKSACTTTTTTNTASTVVPYYVPGFGFGFEAASQEGFDMEELDRLVEEGCVQPAEVMMEHGMEHQQQQQQQQDFDWKEWPEWDQVFGRFVEVEDHNAVDVGAGGGWGLLESES
ncbi:hypothetical protein BDD12DRAFT_173468 [Trichophaea hybrida]|nr:hypothetical protein BDD12DRAFT_173468 [Trichophaea hybrida]